MTTCGNMIRSSPASQHLLFIPLSFDGLWPLSTNRIKRSVNGCGPDGLDSLSCSSPTAVSCFWLNPTLLQSRNGTLQTFFSAWLPIKDTNTTSYQLKGNRANDCSLEVLPSLLIPDSFKVTRMLKTRGFFYEKRIGRLQGAILASNIYWTAV